MSYCVTHLLYKIKLFVIERLYRKNKICLILTTEKKRVEEIFSGIHYLRLQERLLLLLFLQQGNFTAKRKGK